MADDPSFELNEDTLQELLAELTSPSEAEAETTPTTDEVVDVFLNLIPDQLSEESQPATVLRPTYSTSPFDDFDDFGADEFLSEPAIDLPDLEQAILDGLALVHAGQTQAAREHLEHLIAQADYLADAWYGLALTASTRREKRLFLRKALNRQPDHHQALRALRRLNWHPQMLVDLFSFDPEMFVDTAVLPLEDERLRFLEPKTAQWQVHLELGINAVRRGDLEAAQLVLNQVLEIDPENPVAWAWLVATAQNEDTCRRCVQQACEYNVTNLYLTVLRDELENRARLRLLLTNPPLYLLRTLRWATGNGLDTLAHRRAMTRANRLLQIRLDSLVPEILPPTTVSLDVRSSVLPRSLLEEMEKLFRKASPAVRIGFERSMAGLVTAEPGTQQERQALEMLYELVLSEDNVGVSITQREALIQRLRSELSGYGSLERLLDDDTITAIFINGAWGTFIERRGVRHRLDQRLFDDEEHILRILERMLRPFGLTVNEQHPFVSARLPDGSRLNAIIRPVALAGATITIRKFPKRPLWIDDLIRFGSITPAIAEFLRACVISRLNILISGGPGSGKLTLANVLSGFIPNDERVISIEHVAQYQLLQEHVIPLESMGGSTSFQELIKQATQMLPDRLVFGDCTGGEMLSVLEAIQTLGEGGLFTIQANSPQDAVTRLETMCLTANSGMTENALLYLIASTVDVIVQIDRLRDGTRKVTRVVEVRSVRDNITELVSLFEFEQTGIEGGKIVGRIYPTGNRPSFTERIESAGIHLPPSVFGIYRREADLSQAPTSKPPRADSSGNTSTLAWQFKTEDEIRGAATVHQNHVYIGSYDTNLWCLSADTGQFLWKYPTQAGIVTTPVIDAYNHMVFFGSEDRVFYALDARTGRLSWSYTTDDKIRCSARLAPDVDVVFFGNDDGILYALSASSGRLLWQYYAGDPIRSRPFLTSDMVIFGTEQGDLHALKLDGSRKWSFRARQAITSSPYVDEWYTGLCYVGSLDGHLYALEVSNGYTSWRFRTEGPIVSSPIVAHNSCLFGSTDGYFYAVNALTGKTKWRFAAGASIVGSPALRPRLEDIVYFGDTDGYLYALDANTGTEHWRYQTRGMITATPAVDAAHLYIGSLDRSLYAIHTTVNPNPTVQPSSQ
ncbi:MAG: Flp pilus assembly complex ATPase component TadA [Anaerolineae bacterium]|nr:Flp pilus assembly complex ATPase component TadA [Anaerolineae bacterium]